MYPVCIFLAFLCFYRSVSDVFDFDLEVPFPDFCSCPLGCFDHPFIGCLMGSVSQPVGFDLCSLSMHVLDSQGIGLYDQGGSF